MSEETAVAVEPTGVAVPVRDLRLVAENPNQLAIEQERLIGWCKGRIADLTAHASELAENLDIAKRSKWRTSALVSALSRERGRVSYYTKMLAALEAGFFIVPNFDASVFAVRTNKRVPLFAVAQDSGSYANPRVRDIDPGPAPLGEGRHVNNRPMVQRREYTDTTTGKPVEMVTLTTTDFNEEIEFPFALAKPQVLQATQAAMALKIFDDLAVLPRSLRTSGDPMVVGIIRRKEGYTVKRCTFLISWFLDTEEL